MEAARVVPAEASSTRAWACAAAAAEAAVVDCRVSTTYRVSIRLGPGLAVRALGSVRRRWLHFIYLFCFDDLDVVGYWRVRGAKAQAALRPAVSGQRGARFDLVGVITPVG